MKHLLYTAALTLTLASCSKEDMQAQTIIDIRIPEEPVILTKKEPIITVTTPSTTTTYTLVDTIGFPIITGMGTVTETITDITKPNSPTEYSYGYQITPADGWALIGYEVVGRLQWGGDISIETQERYTRFEFLPETVVESNGIRIHFYGDTGDQTTDINSINSSLSLLTDDTLQYIDDIHLTQQTNYFFGGLAIHRAFVLNNVTTDYVITHEAGHVWASEDDDYDHAVWTMLQETEPVSNYGATSISENFADAFTFYYTNQPLPDNTRAVLDEILK